MKASPARRPAGFGARGGAPGRARRALAGLALAAALAAPPHGAGAASSSASPDAVGARVVAVDDAGHTVSLAAPARRIVTLAPHLTELAFAAGAGDRVAAVSRFSDYPPQAASRPVIGDAFTVDYEALARLQPDLVLVWGSGTAARTKEKLRALGWPVYEVEIRDVAGLAATLRHIGTLAGTRPVADARAQAISTDWAALQAEYAGRRPVRVFFQLWDAPLMTLNGQHLVSSAITACGGRNVFADVPTLTATVSWEAAVRRDPEIVLAGGSASEPARPGRWTEFPQVSATRRHQFARVDGDLLLRSGPRFVQGAREMCEAIERTRQGQPQR
jgi:iron complex transport system substrate-binding protein